LGIADRGSQYASDSHRKLLKQHGIQQSMSRKGTNWDNAVSESFFHTLKTECVNHENYTTRDTARKSIFDTIEVFYNRQRLHSSNGYLSPVEFEMQHKACCECVLKSVDTSLLNGDYIQVIRMQGAAHESADIQDINSWHDQLNGIMRNIASPNVAI
jgi:Integrase core domain